MPYMEEDPIPLIQSDLDLQDTVEAGAAQDGYYSEKDLEFGADPSAGPTVISLAEGESSAMPPAPIADMGEVFDEVEIFGASLSAKKLGRPFKSASSTPAKSVASASKTPRSGKSVAVTPRSAKSTSAPKSARASTGRKRKAEETVAEQSEEAEDQEEEKEEEEEEPESTPAPKRSRTTGRPSRTAGVAASARLTAKKSARGRPKSTTTTEKKPKGKGSRPKKNAEANGASSDGEYEVEAIRDSRIDADTMQHWYEIKWKGYPESDNSWEPKANLKHSLDLVKAFDAKKKKQDIEDAAAKAKETVSKGTKVPKSASKVVKPVKPVKKAAPAQNAPGRRGRPARTTRGSKK